MKFLGLIALSLVLASCAVEGPDTSEEAAGVITPLQCTQYTVGHKVTICHRTSSAVNPYVTIKVDTDACFTGHGGHMEDFIPVSGTCPTALVTPTSVAESPTCTGPGDPSCYVRDSSGTCVQICI